jgi:hypothetical protein
MSVDSGTSDEGPETNDEGGPSTLIFVPDNDLISASQCDSFLQDCEPGEKCVPYASGGGNWNANKCVPVLGDGKIGEPCTYAGAVEATDSCDASSMCWNVGDVDGEAIGTCTAFCTGTPDDPACPSGSSCSMSCDGSLSVCTKNCDPLLQDCLGTGCYWAGSRFQCVFTTADIEEGGACGFINDCKPGLLCANPEVLPSCEGSACCTAFCDLGVGAGACGIPGTECLPFFEEGMALPEYAHIGICMVPPG